LNAADEAAVVAAARAGDESAFAALVERYRRELRVHCYRMLGSLDESEDLVQEAFLRAWKHLDAFQGRSTFRAWLYRIATNACLDALGSRSRRVLPHQVMAPSTPEVALPPRNDIAWLQPFPDRLWEPVAPAEAEPDAEVVARETIELAFLATIQHLPPRQRAVLILRDVLGWPAKQTAEALDGSIASANSALQRARATLREHLPERRLDWAPSAEPTERERAVLRRYMDAVERGDLETVAELLAEDVRATMPPFPMWPRRGRRVAGGELGPRQTRLCGPLPAGAHPRQPAARGRRLHPGARRPDLPCLRHRGAADRARPHRRADRVPRPGPVRRVRPAHRAAGASMTFRAARRLNTGWLEPGIDGGTSDGQAAVLGHHVARRLHRRRRW
jgi:RNA polymerase sigma-70 factor (ECF subfamily)